MKENPSKNHTQKLFLIVTKSNWGGAQKYVYDIANNLPRSQYDITVIFGEGGKLKEMLSAINVKTIKIESLSRDVSIFKDFSVLLDLMRIFMREKPDIIHLNSSKIGGLGAVAGILSGVKKRIFTVHGFAFNENRSWLQKKIIAFFSWLTLFFNTHIIFISRKEYEVAQKWLFVFGKKTIIYNGIRGVDFLSKEESRRDIAQSNKDNYVIGSIGELTTNKGYGYALEAFKMLKNVPGVIYIIIGTGEHEEKLKSVAASYGISERVIFLGFVTNASKLLKGFDLFILTSLKEGLPYVLLEAGLAQIPVIASDVGGIPEIIKDKVSGLLVKPKDVDGIVKAIEYMRANPNEAQKMAHNLHEKVLRDFSIEKMISQTSDLYQK